MLTLLTYLTAEQAAESLAHYDSFSINTCLNHVFDSDLTFDHQTCVLLSVIDVPVQYYSACTLIQQNIKSCLDERKSRQSQPMEKDPYGAFFS